MKPRNVLYSLFLVLLLVGVAIVTFRCGPTQQELFDRTPTKLRYTKHALCRMDCRQIDKGEIREIMEKGIINLNKSDRNDRPCPTYALQGRTASGENIRVIFAQCSGETKVVTCYNLEEDFECHCPGDEKKSNR